MKSFELASTTPISVAELRAGASRPEGPLYEHYVEAEPSAEASALIDALSSESETLEAHARALSGRERLFTLGMLFRAHLGSDQETTDVPGHGTVNDVGVADGTLSVHENLMVEGVLVVAGDLVVGGQLVVGPGGQVIVGGDAQIAAMISGGNVSVAGDLHAMFLDLAGADHSLDVGGELDSFLLIQNQQEVRIGSISVGLHAVITADGPAAVFRREVLRDGEPDWMAIARAARAGDDVFVDGYMPPTPGEDHALHLL